MLILEVVKIFPGLIQFILAFILVIVVLIYGLFIIRTIFPNIKLKEQVLIGYPMFLLLVYSLFIINIIFNGIIFGSKLILFYISTGLFLIFTFLNRSIFQYKELFKISLYRIKLGIFLILILLIYSLPIIQSSSGIVFIEGDMRWHFFYINQILLGESIPTNIYANVPNSYPWLFHGIIAFLYLIIKPIIKYDHIQSLFLAYNVINIINIIWGFFAIYSLGNILFKKSEEKKVIAIFLGIFSGGLGFLVIRRPFVIATGFLKYYKMTLGDMVIVYPYNASLLHISPSWPRDLSYVIYLTLLYSLIKFLTCKTNKNKYIWTLLSGILLGLCGLIQTIPFLITNFIIIIIFISNIKRKKFRLNLFIILLLAFIIIFPWAGPYLFNSLKYGTLSITKMHPHDLPPHLIITAIGQVSLFSPIGFYYIIKNNNLKNILSSWYIINIYLYIFIIIIIISNFNSYFNLNIDFLDEFFFRQHKFWFLLYPILALYSTEYIYIIMSILKKVKIIIYFKLKKCKIYPLKILFIILIIILGIGSPIFTSIGTAQLTSNNIVNKEFKQYRKDQLMIVIRENLVKGDVLAISPNEKWLIEYIQSFTGAYIVYIDRPRIKFAEIISNIYSQEERVLDLSILYSSNSSISEKIDIINKYNITHIVTESKIDNFPNELILDVYLTSVQNRNFYLYILSVIK